MLFCQGVFVCLLTVYLYLYLLFIYFITYLYMYLVKSYIYILLSGLAVQKIALPTFAKVI